MRRWMSLLAILMVATLARADGNYVLQPDGTVKAESAAPLAAAPAGTTYMLGADGTVKAVEDAAPPKQTEPEPDPAPEPQAAPAATPDVCVVDVQWEGRGGSGTCVWSENGKSLVITNAHVAPANGRCSVVHEGKRYRAEWVAAAGDADLAALLVDGTLPVAPVADAEPPKGARVRKWGFPGYAGGAKVFGAGPLLTRGSSIVIIGFMPSPGDSGSALFDEDGRIVGVIRTRDDYHRTGGAVGLRMLRAFLDRIRDRVSARAARRVADLTTAWELVASGKKVLLEVKEASGVWEGWDTGVYECWKDADGVHQMRLLRTAPPPQSAPPARSVQQPVMPFGNCPPGLR